MDQPVARRPARVARSDSDRLVGLYMKLPKLTQIHLCFPLLMAVAAMPLSGAAESTDSGDRDDRGDARRADEGGIRPYDRSRDPGKNRGRSFSYKELYGDRAKAQTERRNREQAQEQPKKAVKYKRRSEFKYQGDKTRDDHISHRSYRGRGSPYGSGRDKRGFGGGAKDKRRAR